MKTKNDRTVPCELIWNHLTLKTRQGKTILSDVSGKITPNTLTAIIGASGAGKTTLLNCLSGRVPGQLVLGGTVELNGRARDTVTWPLLASYVGQEFFAYPHQKVYETLHFASSIKNIEHPDEQVNEILDLLRMEQSKNTMIKNLSGGERIRTSLGIELLGNPRVIMLDEPISGLDSYNAQHILEIIQKISRTNKTILMTVHQPSYRMSQCFDKIIIMSRGSPIFEGTVHEGVLFFEECGLRLPKNTNPTDFFLDVLSTAESEDSERLAMIRRKWNARTGSSLQGITDQITVDPKRSESIVFHRLLCRAFVETARNRPYMLGRVLQRLFIGLVVSLTFMQLGVYGANAFSFKGIMILYVQTELFGVSSPIFNQFSEEKKIIDRERKSGLYSGFAAYYAKFVVELVFTVIYVIPYVLITYYIIGLIGNFGTFMIFLLILLTLDVFSVSLGLTVGTVTPSTSAAQLLGITINVVFFIYSGALGNPPQIPSWLRWLVWLSPPYYILSAVTNNQLNSLPMGSGVATANAFEITGSESLQSYQLNTLSTVANIFIVLGYSLLYQIVGATVLHIKTKNRLNMSAALQEVAI